MASDTVNINKIRIYACGGAATNIGFKYDTMRTLDKNSFAETVLSYVDTSASNLVNKQVNQDKVFLIEGTDGSGKNRSSNHEVIQRTSLSILQKFQPEKMNIVLHSASGGSGSVIGPVIVSELKKRGEQVIVICIGSTNSIIESKNTFKSLEGYENISKLRESSVVMHYLENKGNRSETDDAALWSITMLANLYSGKHEELDSADLKSWLEYATKSTATPTLASLTFNKPEHITDIKKIVSVVSLTTLEKEQETLLETPPPYQAVGYYDRNNNSEFNKDTCHFAISYDYLVNGYGELKAMVDKYEADLLAATTTNAKLVPKDTMVTESGLIL